MLDATAASGFQAPGTDNILVSVRKAMTTIYASGYNPDTLILTPATAEAIDVMVTGVTGGTADFVFGAGRFAPGTLFGLNVRVSKTAAAPIVVDAAAFGRLYVSPISLATFEENAGETNTTWSGSRATRSSASSARRRRSGSQRADDGPGREAAERVEGGELSKRAASRGYTLEKDDGKWCAEIGGTRYGPMRRSTSSTSSCPRSSETAPRTAGATRGLCESRHAQGWSSSRSASRPASTSSRSRSGSPEPPPAPSASSSSCSRAARARRRSSPRSRCTTCSPSTAAVYCAASSREQARILFEAAAEFARGSSTRTSSSATSSCAGATTRTSRSLHAATCACSPPTRPAARPHAVAGDHRRAARPPGRRRLHRAAHRDAEAARLAADHDLAPPARAPTARSDASAPARSRNPTVAAAAPSPTPAARPADARMVACPRTPTSTTRAGQEGATRPAGSRRGARASSARPCPSSPTAATTATNGPHARAHWLPAGAWQACVGEPDFTDGEPIWVGVDVGGERSRHRGRLGQREPHVGCEIYHGDAGVLDCIDLIRELAGRYQLVEVVYDPWRFGQAAQELEQRGIPVVAFPQTDVRMIPASTASTSAVVEQRLTLPDDDELRQHAANTIARHSRRGWRLDKPALEQPNDAIIALCMALERDREPARTRAGARMALTTRCLDCGRRTPGSRCPTCRHAANTHATGRPRSRPATSPNGSRAKTAAATPTSVRPPGVGSSGPRTMTPR